MGWGWGRTHYFPGDQDKVNRNPAGTRDIDSIYKSPKENTLSTQF